MEAGRCGADAAGCGAGAASPDRRRLRRARSVSWHTSCSRCRKCARRPRSRAPSGKRIELRPARELRVTYTIDFPHPAVGRQSITVVITPESYSRSLAPARTFGFLAEYEQLKAHGLARGASAANCIVIGKEAV